MLIPSRMVVICLGRSLLSLGNVRVQIHRFQILKQPISSTAGCASVDVLHSDAVESERNPYKTSCVWESPSHLAQVLSRRVVASNKHFVVIDKPAGLSVWGHSLASREALSLLDKSKDQNAGLHLSVKDCLPELAKLLDPRWARPETVSEHSVFQHGRMEQPESIEAARGSVPSLFIVEPLPANYSGLILLARTPEYKKAAEQFYRAALFSKPPWYLYQRFVAVCMGHPTRATVLPAEPFPIASYPLNSHLSCSYRPPPSELSTKQRIKGKILYKYIGHDTLSRSASQTSLISIQTNSTYRGLVELYLLHEGCTVVGELLQSSRLVTTGVTSLILHPSRATLSHEHPLNLRRRLGNPGFHYIPIHLHRTSLLIPSPVGGNRGTTSDYFRPLVARTHGLIHSAPSGLGGLRWTRISDPSDPNEPSETAKNHYALTCHSPHLPTYFPYSMERLGLQFDYPTWIDSL